MKKNIKGILKKNKGFTLVELIVIIAILGILVAVAVPRLTGFQDEAKEKTDQATRKTIENAVVLAVANEEITFNGIDDSITEIKISWDNDDDTGEDYNVETLTGTTATNIINVMKKYLGDTPPVSKKGDGFTVTISRSGNVSVVRNGQ